MATVYDVANCFLYLDKMNEGEGISNLKLQKLVYYAQGFYSAIYSEPLFNGEIEAWVHGPVVPELYHHYKTCGSASIPLSASFDPENLGAQEFELIEEVFDIFGQFSAWKLRNMTHEEQPWLDHEKQSEAIPLEEITEYFKTRIQ